MQIANIIIFKELIKKVMNTIKKIMIKSTFTQKNKHYLLNLILMKAI